MTDTTEARKEYCKADRDGDCDWDHCPQLRDNEPHHSGRHCPIDTREEDFPDE